MSITSDLEQILSARYGKDVRQAIHDSIEEGYNIAVQAQGIAETSQESAEAYAQAALASEQAAEDYKTAAEQAAQQAMSGTPEGYADLVAKVNSIYRQTATSYNVVGTSEGSALARTIYGMSEQDGTPTPSVPVDIDSAVANFKCIGKNLIPYPYAQSSLTIRGVTFTVRSDGSVLANGQNDGTGNSNFYIIAYDTNQILLKKGEYTLKGCPSGGEYNKYRLALISSSVTGLISDFGGGANYSNASDQLCGVQVQVANGFNAQNLVFNPLLVYKDVADKSFEPYQHTDVTTDLTLRAIEVASTGDYTYERDGKYYIADTIDWSEDKGYQITRRVEHFHLETVNYFQDRGNNLKQINVVLPKKSKFLGKGYSNRFKVNTSITRSSGDFYIDNTGSTTHIWVGFVESTDITNTTTGTTWLSNNETYVDYVLADSAVYTEPITSEQAQALLSLKTYDEATSISATGDIEPSLDLEYSKDRNTALALTGHNLAHKNALKLNDINTALIELGGN